MVANQQHSVRRRLGFTLVELMIVIGLLALLLAILLPAFVGARRQARVVWCASNLRQITAAMHAYAIDNKGHFPNLDVQPGTGKNVWDVSHFYTASMVRLNVDFRTFICPASQVDPSVARTAYSYYNWFNVIEYNIWVPRMNGPDVVPPAPSYSGPNMAIVSPRPTEPFAGPSSVFDNKRAENPVITDIVGTSRAVTPPANADASVGGNPYQISGNSNHLEGLQLKGINCSYVDGHVEFHNGNEVHPYYLGDWWNWR